jgi:hypothetical protein
MCVFCHGLRRGNSTPECTTGRASARPVVLLRHSTLSPMCHHGGVGLLAGLPLPPKV